MKADTANGIDCSGTQPTSAYNGDAQGASAWALTMA